MKDLNIRLFAAVQKSSFSSLKKSKIAQTPPVLITLLASSTVKSGSGEFLTQKEENKILSIDLTREFEEKMENLRGEEDLNKILEEGKEMIKNISLKLKNKEKEIGRFLFSS